MLMKICVQCGDEFDLHSPLKAHAGGKINECPDCCNETAVRYLGLTSGDGKAAGVTILSFNSRSDREKYKHAWMATSGMHKGKSCNMSPSAPIMSGLKFNKVHEYGLGMNHKGKS